jgi:predicted signal transduction protein with EAL and GGDEF domain
VNWILPAQTLLDLISSDATPAHAWAGSVDTRALRVSVISFAQARSAIMRVADAGVRSRLDSDFGSLIAQLEADSGVPPLPFIAAHASVWEALMHEPSVSGVPQIDRQVYATAMYEGLTVVEETHAATPALRALGIEIHDI